MFNLNTFFPLFDRETTHNNSYKDNDDHNSDDKSETSCELDVKSDFSGSTTIDYTNECIQETDRDSKMPIPICLVDGFLCSPNMNIWHDLIAHFRESSFKKQQSCPLIVRPNSGGVSSAYDTAVSIFYQLKGGLEDYGEIHSKNHYHHRFGKKHVGQYKRWSKRYPLNFIGHSFGGNVILLLQKLLNEKIFYNHMTGERYDTDSSWICSVSTISSPLKGSTGTLLLGHQIGNPGSVDLISVGRLLYGICHLWEWLELPGLKSMIGVDFRMSHFKLNEDRSFFNLAKNLLTLNCFEKGVDTAAYDISLERCDLAPLKTFDTTYYRSYCAKLTNTDLETKCEIPIEHWCLPLVALSRKIGNFDFKTIGNGALAKFEKEQALWRANDGLVPLISQFHPGKCSPTTCKHYDFKLDDEPTDHNDALNNIKPGVWYSTTVQNCSHIDLIPCITPPLRSLWEKVSKFVINSAEPPIAKYDPELIENYRTCIFNDYENFLNQIEKERFSK
ncbi:alpha/beta-hydrolase [Neoconidiobolus thromboides FSU 785]|nr:alpha/beta-hydrolase [Neoconidiobolus thromboides FSU 785]